MIVGKFYLVDGDMCIAIGKHRVYNFVTKKKHRAFYYIEGPFETYDLSENTLVLTNEQAKALNEVLGGVVLGTTGKPNKIFQIMEQLNALGVPYDGNSIEGEIRFV